ncbi:MAG: MipA/OmpV family protein [Pseudomonadota bacterium]
MKRLVCGAAMALAAGLGCAGERPLWELGMGVGVLQLPHYRGSDQSHTWVLPVPYVVYRGKIFKADREGARAVLYETPRLNFDLSVSASAPTRSEDNQARRGMDDLPPTFELGPNLNLTLLRQPGWKLELRAPLRAAVSLQRHPRNIGWIAAPNLNLDLHVASGWNLGLQAAALYSNRRYNAHFYEVSEAQALPDRPAYRAEGGYGGLQFTAATSRRVGNTWMGAFVRYDSLRGAAFIDSPLVRQRDHWTFGFAVSWVFAASSRTVDTPE